MPQRREGTARPQRQARVRGPKIDHEIVAAEVCIENSPEHGLHDGCGPTRRTEPTVDPGEMCSNGLPGKTEVVADLLVRQAETSQPEYLDLAIGQLGHTPLRYRRERCGERVPGDISATQRHDGRCGTVRNAELAEDRFVVCLDGVLRQEHPPRDLLVRPALSHQLQDLDLLRDHQMRCIPRCDYRADATTAVQVAFGIQRRIRPFQSHLGQHRTRVQLRNRGQHVSNSQSARSNRLAQSIRQHRSA